MEAQGKRKIGGASKRRGDSCEAVLVDAMVSHHWGVFIGPHQLATFRSSDKGKSKFCGMTESMAWEATKSSL
jgi:hypothetical protein